MKKSLLVVVLAVLAVAACKGEDVSATVNCKVNEGPSIECAVVQTKGKSEIDVCWDFVLECPGGAKLEAERTCQKIKDGGARNVTIPAEKIKITGKCERDPRGQLFNMTINGKPST